MQRRWIVYGARVMQPRSSCLMGLCSCTTHAWMLCPRKSSDLVPCRRCAQASTSRQAMNSSRKTFAQRKISTGSAPSATWAGTRRSSRSWRLASSAQRRRRRTLARSRTGRASCSAAAGPSSGPGAASPAWTTASRAPPARTPRLSASRAPSAWTTLCSRGGRTWPSFPWRRTGRWSSPTMAPPSFPPRSARSSAAPISRRRPSCSRPSGACAQTQGGRRPCGGCRRPGSRKRSCWHWTARGPRTAGPSRCRRSLCMWRPCWWRGVELP
mmetsp:Transcript_32001/g.76040  ORF Transcript_32001/g.76040 Transcript_32001/m.76040 type:complete len:269 (-) Transcript_32001:179-985(-)